MPRKNPAELEIDLFVSGVRLDPSSGLDDTMEFNRTRAGLGSGIEAIIPGDPKDIWMNIPAREKFAKNSPYLLKKSGEGFVVEDRRDDESYEIRLRPRPQWYDRKTASGKPMARIAVMQGTYLGVYIGETCDFWREKPSTRCRFCTTGVNVGKYEEEEKHVSDVIEVANAAKVENKISFVHFNSGFHLNAGVEIVAPYVKAVKEQVGAMVGVQLAPDHDFWKYDQLIDMGVEHFSFCYEFHNPEYFREYLPGKEKHLSRRLYFDALEYTSRKLGKGRCSGEIIAGIEPIQDTLDAIDYITSVGAFPTVCIFRPLVDADLEAAPSPQYRDMLAVFQYMIESCRKNSVPIGLAPNLEVSLVVLPTDALYLAPQTSDFSWYKARLAVLKTMARPYFGWRMRKHKIGSRGDKLLALNEARSR